MEVAQVALPIHLQLANPEAPVVEEQEQEVDQQVLVILQALLRRKEIMGGLAL